MTSRFKASTILDVYRDNSGLAASGAFDGYDDDADSTTPIGVDLPAHLHNGSTVTLDPATGRRTMIEKWTGRMRPGADVQASDRIHDKRTGFWFTVDEAFAPPLVVGSADVRLKLTRIAR
jgi:hypothetical protein